MPTNWSRRDLVWKGDKLMLGTRNTGVKIIADSKWPKMYRVEYPPGVISDMGNLSRIRDAAMDLVIYRLNGPSSDASTPIQATRIAAPGRPTAVLPSSGYQQAPQ